MNCRDLVRLGVCFSRFLCLLDAMRDEIVNEQTSECEYLRYSLNHKIEVSIVEELL